MQPNLKDKKINIFLQKNNETVFVNHILCKECKHFVKCYCYNCNCQLYEYIKARVEKATMAENKIIIKNADESKTVTIINRAIRLRKFKNFSR